MSRIKLILIIFLITIAGCKKEEPNPELRDPIYKFFVEQSSVLKPALEGEKKKLEDLLKDYAKAEANTPEKKQALKNIYKAQKKIVMLQQEVDYNEIRKERRRVEARKAYRIAFQNNESWPDPIEGKIFSKNQELRAASRSWDKRVPRNPDRYRKPAAASGAKTESKGH